MRIIIACCALTSALFATSSDVALIVDAPAPLAPVVERSLKTEVASIFRDTSYGFQWVNRLALRPTESFEDLVVVRFKTPCRADAVRKPGKALAWAHMTEAGILPFVDIDCGQVVRMMRGATTEMELGRALGRVVAHELYHVLSGSANHAAAGVAQAALSPAHLTCAALEFTSREVAMLTRRSLAPAASAEELAIESGR